MRRDKMIINTGTTSLIMIFVVLALVTFAALSLSASSAGWRMAQKMADRTAAYYRAEAEAMTLLADLEERLETVREYSTEENYVRQVQEAAASWEEVRWEEDCICWEVPIQEGQELAAAVRSVYERTPEDTLYEIVTWNTQDTEPWQSRQTLELFGTGEAGQAGTSFGMTGAVEDE